MSNGHLWHLKKCLFDRGSLIKLGLRLAIPELHLPLLTGGGFSGVVVKAVLTVLAFVRKCTSFLWRMGVLSQNVFIPIVFLIGNLDTGIDFVQSSVAVDGYFIYIVGGRNSSGFSSDFHFTDVRTGIWSKISTKCKKIVTEPNLT